MCNAQRSLFSHLTMSTRMVQSLEGDIPPEKYTPALAELLLCAGVTLYAAMFPCRMNQPGKSPGVIGIGSLGYLEVKCGKAFRLNVKLFSTSKSKEEEALHLMGADKFVVSSDQKQMTVHFYASCSGKNETDNLYLGLSGELTYQHVGADPEKSLDFIIDAASGEHPLI